MDFEQSNYTAAVNNYTRVINTSKSSRLLPYAYSKRAASYYNLKNYGQTQTITLPCCRSIRPTRVSGFAASASGIAEPGQPSGEFDKYLAQFKQANPDAKGIEIRGV